MRKLFFLIIAMLFFSNISLAKSYSQGQLVRDEFVVSKYFKVKLSPGDWIVVEKNRDGSYGIDLNFWGIAKVENNELTEYIRMMEFKIAGYWVGHVNPIIHELTFKDKYDGCYERPEYYLLELYTKGSTHNCMIVSHLDLFKEIFNPDDPIYGKASVAKLKKWINDTKVNYPRIALHSHHDFFSHTIRGDWLRVTYTANPKIYNAPEAKKLSEENSEYHKYNIENFPEHKNMMEKWISISAKRHKEFENNNQIKNSQKLHLDKYISQINIESKSIKTKSKNDLTQQLKKLSDLYKSGLLTKEEFEKAKKKILN